MNLTPNQCHQLVAENERLRKVIITTIHDLNTAGSDDRPQCKNSFFIGMANNLKEVLKGEVK